MRKPRPSPFRALQREWYSKLSASGFVDIEDGEERLLNWDSFTFRSDRFPELQFKEVENYFRVATQLLELHRFKDETERRIWELHCEGHGIHRIAKAVTTKEAPVSWLKVQRLINQIKEWIPYYDDCDPNDHE